MKRLLPALAFVCVVPAVYAVALSDPWVENRIVYNANLPEDRDGLKGEADYFPADWLDRVAACGMNGVWMKIELRRLAKTSLTPRTAEGERRIRKLRDVARKCRAHGLKLWIFGNEPARFRAGDPLLKAHPELGGAFFPTHGSTMWCPASPAVLAYVEEAMRDLFAEVPELGGFLNISYGEGLTTCLDAEECCDIEQYGAKACPRCAAVPKWKGHYDMCAAIVRGIRAAGSDARYISWFYQPMATSQRYDWVAECAAHVPDGATMMFNFESGTVVEQLGKGRCGGDYWLSNPGPGAPFAAVAAKARSGGVRLGAKIQTCNSHELATLPFIPVPGLLYRKYRAMRGCGVKDVMQSWYFGGEPTRMLKAAGLLSREDFSDGEEAFLRRLAADWGEDADLVAGLWKSFSDAFVEYPLSNVMQYYGPFHAGLAWRLCARVECGDLPRTWHRGESPAGDRIGECLAGFTLAEAETLSGRMAEKSAAKDASGHDLLDELAHRHAEDAEHMREIGVMRAFRIQLASAHAIFRFYLLRTRGDRAAALEMRRIAEEEIVRVREMIPLCAADSRLGFHAEAATRHYDPEILRERMRSLEETVRDLDAIAAELSAGRPWPVSARERETACVSVGGGWMESSGVRWKAEDEGSELVIRGECPAKQEGLAFVFSDYHGAEFPCRCHLSKPGTGMGFYEPQETVGRCHGSTEALDDGRWRFEVRCEGRPGWFTLVDDTYYPRPVSKALWPASERPLKRRGSLLWVDGAALGRVRYPARMRIDFDLRKCYNPIN